MKSSSTILAEITPTLNANISHFINSLPCEIVFDDDKWDISRFHRHEGKRGLSFIAIENLELRALCKACITESRSTNAIGISAIQLLRGSFTYLSLAIGERSPLSLNAVDFSNAERIMRSPDGHSNTTANLRASNLRRVAQWFSRQLGLRIEYHPTFRNYTNHGRFGTDKGRANKLIPDSVISDVLALRHLPELELRDRFFLNLLAVAVATGFRINELFSLPADCLIRDEGTLRVINFPSKGGKSAPRPIAPEFVEMLETCILELHAITEPPRALALKLDKSSLIDWHKLFTEGDANAIDVGMRVWAKKWISAPHRRMLDPNMGYSRQYDKWFEIDSAYSRLGSAARVSKAMGINRAMVTSLLEQTESSRKGLVFVANGRPVTSSAFETDPRVCSFNAFVNDTKIPRKLIRNNGLVNSILQETINAQIFQQKWVEPENSDATLMPFRRQQVPNLTCHKTNEVRLYARDALCTIFRGQLSTVETDETRLQTCTSMMFSHWLSGTGRGRGTKKRSDSLCSRFEIVDPRSSEIAKFTAHDLRHWLNTAYEEGGLSQEQLGIVFNRKNIQTNATYSQTSALERSNRLREATREGLMVGQHANTFARLSQDSPEDAEQYLAASTKLYNPMPHGLCTLNMALEACPHSLSCFSFSTENDTENDDLGYACEHLIIDPDDIAQQREIKRINNNAVHIIKFFETDEMTSAPQYKHFKKVKATTGAFMKRMNLK